MNHQTAGMKPSRAATTDVDRLLNKAERSFLRKDYRQALLYVDEAFGCLNGKSSRASSSIDLNNDEKKIVTLYPSIQVPTHEGHAARNKNLRIYQFTVDLTRENSRMDPGCQCQFQEHRLADNFASIGLQSWHELALKEREATAAAPTTAPAECLSTTSDEGWEFLHPIIRYYSIREEVRYGIEHRAISMELLLVWIPFWESQGYCKEAFLWTVQVLLAASAATAEDEDNRSDGTDNVCPNVDRSSFKSSTPFQELLWLHCVCNQLPRIRDSQLAVKILQAVSKHPQDSLHSSCDDIIKFQMVERTWSRHQTQRGTINSLLACLETQESIGDHSHHQRCPSSEQMTDDHNESSSRVFISSRYMKKAKQWLAKEYRDFGDPTEEEHPMKTFNSNHKVSLGSTPPLSSNSSVPVEDQLTRNPVPDGSSIRLLPPIFGIQLQKGRLFLWLKRTINDLTKIIVGNNANFGTILAEILAPGIVVGSNSGKDASLLVVTRRISTAAFSVAVLLLSWRRRKLFSRIGASLAWTILAPFKELVDAIMVTSDAIGTGRGGKTQTDTI
jgi:hypothetical protein